MDSTTTDWIDVISQYSDLSENYRSRSAASCASDGSAADNAFQAASLSVVFVNENGTSSKSSADGRRDRVRKATKTFVDTPLAPAITKRAGDYFSPKFNRSLISAYDADDNSERSPLRRRTYYKEYSRSFCTWEISQSIYPLDVIETPHVVVSKDARSKTINNYLMLGLLGKGSFGKVKLVECLLTGQKFAMKILRTSVAKGDQKRRTALQREIAIMKRVSHPNIVRLHEVLGSPDAKKLYLVLQYVNGGCIAKRLTNFTVQPVMEHLLRRQARQLVSALKYLEVNGVVHRDIKPDNILVDEKGKVYLSDFGLSAICTEEGVRGVEGTPAFMAPEVCRGDAEVTGHLVDIWAFGVSLFQLMYGVLPFVAPNIIDLARRIMSDPLVFPDEDPRRWLPYVDEFGLDDVRPSPEFKELMRGILEKEPSKRWGIRRILSSYWLRIFPEPSAEDSVGSEDSLVSLCYDVSCEDISRAISPAETMYI